MSIIEEGPEESETPPSTGFHGLSSLPHPSTKVFQCYSMVHSAFYLLETLFSTLIHVFQVSPIAEESENSLLRPSTDAFKVRRGTKFVQFTTQLLKPTQLPNTNDQLLYKLVKAAEDFKEHLHTKVQVNYKENLLTL